MVKKAKKQKEDEEENCLEFEYAGMQNSEVIKIEEKKESLLILATLGITKEYLGEEINILKIHKLKNKDIEKYFNRYQLIQGKKVSTALKSKGIKLGIKMISYLLPIDNQEELLKDLENDELVNNELSNMIGMLILKGGRFIALASGLVQIANHVVTEPAQQLAIDLTTISKDVDNKSEDS